MAKEIFKTNIHSKGNVQVEVESRGFTFRMDEPEELGGDNTAMNPVEALLGTLGACKMIVCKLFAEPHGIVLKDISIEMSGELDTDGLMGINPDAKIGFSKITTSYKIEADNTDEEIDAFIKVVESTCPVADTIINTPEMETKRH